MCCGATNTWRQNPSVTKSSVGLESGISSVFSSVLVYHIQPAYFYSLQSGFFISFQLLNIWLVWCQVGFSDVLLGAGSAAWAAGVSPKGFWCWETIFPYAELGGFDQSPKCSWVMREDLKNKCSGALPTLHGCRGLCTHGKRGCCSALSCIPVSSGIICPTPNRPASPSVAAPAVASFTRDGQKRSVVRLAPVGRAPRGRGTEGWSAPRRNYATSLLLIKGNWWTCLVVRDFLEFVAIFLRTPLSCGQLDPCSLS